MPSSYLTRAIDILKSDDAESNAFTQHVDSMSDEDLVLLKNSFSCPDLIGHVMSQAIMESIDQGVADEGVEQTLRAAERLLKAGFPATDLGGNDDSHAGGRVVEGLVEMEDMEYLEPRTVAVAERCIALLVQHGLSLEAPAAAGGTTSWYEDLAAFPGLTAWVASHKASLLDAAWPGSPTPTRFPRM